MALAFRPLNFKPHLHCSSSSSSTTTNHRPAVILPVNSPTPFPPCICSRSLQKSYMYSRVEIRMHCREGARFLNDSKVAVDSTGTIEDDQTVSDAALVKNTTDPAPISTTFRARLVGQGYKQVCGDADAWGDGVVPEVSAHLEGALNITLDGAYHSPVGSDDVSRPWYGSPAVVEQWIHHLLN